MLLAAIHAGGATLAQAERRERRAERAQRRSLRALQAMATVRRLLAPTIQLNVAERQVNVVGLALGGGDADASLKRTRG